MSALLLKTRSTASGGACITVGMAFSSLSTPRECLGRGLHCTVHSALMRSLPSQVFTPLAAAATVGVWGVVLQTPKQVASIEGAQQLQH